MYLPKGEIINNLCVSTLLNCGRVTHICVRNLTIIGSDDCLSPGRCHAIIWTDAGILLIWSSETDFNENLIKNHTFSFKTICLKMSSGRWRPLCLGLHVLTLQGQVTHTYIVGLCHHWFRQWCVVYAAPSHNLNQWRLIVKQRYRIVLRARQGASSKFAHKLSV